MENKFIHWKPTPSMVKQGRVSLRITEELNRRIDKAIEKADGQIKNRSEFGNKAIQFYLDFIEHTQSEDELIMHAILGLARYLDMNQTSSLIEKILNSSSKLPSTYPNKRQPTDHPDFDKLLGLFNHLEGKTKTDLLKELDNAEYDDIGRLYERYANKHFLSDKRNLQVRSTS